MASVKLLLAACLLSALSLSANAGLLDYIYPAIMTEFYSQVPTKEGYRFKLEEPNGSKREEIGVVMNPDTPDEQLVIMGMYTVYDEKTDTETVTMYTADKDGYKPRYMLKNRKLSAKTLMSSAG
uniref:Larval cuticle protein 5 n=1 Tax=Ceratitis capitata TaxID=7213 RepID=W8BP29_CERCA